MREVEKARKKYEKLRKKYDLPEWREVLLLGIFEEGDFENIFLFSKAIKKSLLNLQAIFQTLLVPEDFLSMQDSKFIKEMRNEVLKGFKKIAYLTRKFSLKSFEALKKEDSDKELALAIKETFEEIEEVLEIYYKILKKLEKGWKEAKVEESSTHYQW